MAFKNSNMATAFAEELRGSILSVIGLVVGIQLVVAAALPAVQNASNLPIVGTIGTLLIAVSIIMMLTKLF